MSLSSSGAIPATWPVATLPPAQMDLLHQIKIILLLRYFKKLSQQFIWRAIWYFCTFCAEARIDLVHLGTDKLSLFADTPLYTGTVQI